MFEQKVLELALKKLFNESSFYISDLKKIGEMLQVNVEQHPNYKYLQALHCVKYSDMDMEIIEQLQIKVAECLRPTFNPSMIAKAICIEGNDHINTEDNYLLN